jgi:HD-like signal output (HDOD) protein
MDSSFVIKRIMESNRIPNLPNQLRRLLAAFNDENLGLQDLARIIEDHPSIVARLIALANSAWAAPLAPISSIDRACAHLGLNIVRSVSIGLALMSPFKLGSCPAFDLRRFWVSSKLVADAASSLATKLPDTSDHDLLQTLHTAGLLHNFGLLCLADIMPRETHQALTRTHNNPEISVNAALSELLGTGFREIGGWLAETWGLPSSLIAVMQHYADPNYREIHWQEARLVGCAAELVNVLYRQEPLPETMNIEKLSLNATEIAAVFTQLETELPKMKALASTLF